MKILILFNIIHLAKDDYNQKMLSIQYLVKLLPKPNFDTLKYLSQHLSRFIIFSLLFQF